MKNILITGAGSGLGKELALLYADENSHVILLGRNIDKLNLVVKEIEQKGSSAEFFSCDISDYHSIENLKKSLKTNHDSIDYLINCAGIGYFGAFSDLTLEELNAMIDINVKGTIMVTQSLITITESKIINIISTAGLRGKSNEAVYCASKFAIRGFTESLQKEYEEEKLQITAVYMGGMATPFWDDSTHIKDRSRLKSPSEVALYIKEHDDGREQIIVK